MKTVSIYDLRDDLATHLSSVRNDGTTLVVRRFGKPIALITPYRADAAPSGDEFFGFLLKSGRGSAIVSRLRRSSGEKARTRAFRS